MPMRLMAIHIKEPELEDVNGTEVKSLKTVEDGWWYKLQYQSGDNKWRDLTDETILLVYEGADPSNSACCHHGTADESSEVC